jgi:glyoxylase-like metal-dependent hydrolase (beta-lactamase superfamily II)
MFACGLEMIFEQIKTEGDNFSYVIGDEITLEAAVVDPSFNADAIVRLVKEKRLNLIYIILTHQHPDHYGESDRIRELFGSKIVAHAKSEISKDITVNDDDTLVLGGLQIRVMSTPGHTKDSICLLFDKAVLTGDTLFVGECGRTDLPDGDVKEMYNSLFKKLMSLSDDIRVYPGHDYGRKPSSTIGEERRTNYTLKERSLGQFIEFMKQP